MKTTIFVNGVVLTDIEHSTLLYCVANTRQTLLNRTMMNIKEEDKELFRSYLQATTRLYKVVKPTE